MKWWLIAQCALLKSTGLVLMWLTDWQALSWCVFFAGGIWVVGHLIFPRWRGLCAGVAGCEPVGRSVWLTIDDGPDPEDTPRILDLLDTYQAKATFFMIGARAAKHRELVAEVRARGHEVACHTYSHPVRDFWYAGRARVAREMDGALSVLNAPGRAVRRYRSPVGIKNVFLRRCLRERGLSCVAWSIRSGDGLGQAPEAIVARVLREVRPGAIVLMHEGPNVAGPVRVDAIRGVLEGLQARDYRCMIPGDATLRCGR